MIVSKLLTPMSRDTSISRVGRRRLQAIAIWKYSTKKDGYQSIGSFHSENVEEFIRIPDSEYIAPELPFSHEQYNHTSNPSTKPFANTQYYQKVYPHLHRNKWTFLNHGAFGLAMSHGIERANSWRNFLESQPLRYFDRYLLNHLVHSARCMVDFCSHTTNEGYKLKLRESVALIPNVTSGMNAVIGGHVRCANSVVSETSFGNKVFYYDIGYGSNKKMCQTYHGTNAISIPFEDEFLPLLQTVNIVESRKSADWNEAAADIFIQALDTAIEKEISKSLFARHSLHGSLLILDHITSNTAIHTPISAIAKYAKEEYGMIVVVDGAHGLLGLDLDMTKLLHSGDGNDDCFNGFIDIYVTNAHKWFSSPRGAAIIFCANPLLRDTILRQPAVISHGVDDGYLSRFLWDGCRDYTAQLSLPVITDYWDSVNTDNVRDEMRRNLLEGLHTLISKWHPEVSEDNKDDLDVSSILKKSVEAKLTLVPLEMHAPMMALVRLPDNISGCSIDKKTSTDAKRIQDILYSQNVEVPVKCIRGVLYARVSCHLYNTADEFEILAKVPLK